MRRCCRSGKSLRSEFNKLKKKKKKEKKREMIFTWEGSSG